MTDLRKAAEMALEAFEKIHEGCGEVKKDNLSKHSNELATLVRKDCIPQIEALRQALAEPDLARVGEVGVWGHGDDMTLRDYFAAKAMQAYIYYGGSGAVPRLVSKNAYAMADEMLEARMKSK